MDDTEEIAANIQIVRTKMAELVKAHSKALMPSFGDGREDQRTIEVLTREITDLLRKSEKRLQKLPASESPEDSNIRKNVQVWFFLLVCTVYSVSLRYSQNVELRFL